MKWLLNWIFRMFFILAILALTILPGHPHVIRSTANPVHFHK